MKPAITPGEILLEDYLIPMSISQNALARALGISPRSINEIVLGRCSITPEMSLKLGKFFNQTKRPVLVQHPNHLRFPSIAQKRKANHCSSNQGLHRVSGLSINDELSAARPIFKI
jgi:addiction module HigA family antidote